MRRDLPFAAVAALVVVVVAFFGTTFVPTGHVGVVTTFGQVTGRQLGEGLSFKLPWQRVTDMSIRTQEIKETASTPSNEGLIVGLEVSLLYRLDGAEASDLFQNVGSNYADIVVVPGLRSAMRSATSGYKAEALYSEAREQVAVDIEDTLRTQLARRGVVIESVLLREIQLPETLKNAIEAKQRAEQESLQMQFVLDKELQEAERKRVEAAGIKDFQDIVTMGISDKLLAWKGIEATEQLANSPNAKIVVIGSAENGLPLILGGGGL